MGKIQDVYEEAKSLYSKSLDSDPLSSLVIKDRTVKEWEDYFSIRISSSDLTLGEVREYLSKVYNRLNLLRSLINFVSRKHRSLSVTYDTTYNLYIEDHLEYSGGRAKNLAKLEREASVKLSASKINIEYYSEILENFKFTYRVLVNMLESLKLIQFNLGSELKHLREN